ncbi:hypothetical protein, partial [Halomonas campaniensis]|uniref:hypothetical protein n=1 Tax=Halomonas campaniensis TaxID=213554 RepID=UPI0039705154
MAHRPLEALPDRDREVAVEVRAEVGLVGEAGLEQAPEQPHLHVRQHDRELGFGEPFAGAPAFGDLPAVGELLHLRIELATVGEVLDERVEQRQ